MKEDHLINVFNETSLRAPKSIIKEVVRQTLTLLAGKASYAINVIFVDNRLMSQLNQRYKKRKGPTDVLAFSFINHDRNFVEPPSRFVPLGDIFVSLEEAQKQKERSLKRTLAILVIHGVLHLLGYSHQNYSKKKLMESRANYILNRLVKLKIID